MLNALRALGSSASISRLACKRYFSIGRRKNEINLELIAVPLRAQRTRAAYYRYGEGTLLSRYASAVFLSWFHFLVDLQWTTNTWQNCSFSRSMDQMLATDKNSLCLSNPNFDLTRASVDQSSEHYYVGPQLIATFCNPHSSTAELRRFVMDERRFFYVSPAAVDVLHLDPIYYQYIRPHIGYQKTFWPLSRQPYSAPAATAQLLRKHFFPTALASAEPNIDREIYWYADAMIRHGDILVEEDYIRFQDEDIEYEHPYTVYGHFLLHYLTTSHAMLERFMIGAMRNNHEPLDTLMGMMGHRKPLHIVGPTQFGIMNLKARSLLDVKDLPWYMRRIAQTSY